MRTDRVLLFSINLILKKNLKAEKNALKFTQTGGMHVLLHAYPQFSRGLCARRLIVFWYVTNQTLKINYCQKQNRNDILTRICTAAPIRDVCFQII